MWKALFGVASIVLFFVLIFSLGVASYCLVRQPIYAAVAALGTLVVGAWIVELLFSDRPPNAQLGLALLILPIIASAWLGWWSFKYDIGWKR